jgi:hypothetical protein
LSWTTCSVAKVFFPQTVSSFGSHLCAYNLRRCWDKAVSI